MKRIKIFIMTLCLLTNITLIPKALSNNSNFTSERNSSYDISTKQDILCLMMAYPEYIKDVERDSNGYIYLVMKSDKKIIYDDKKTKNFEQKLSNADLQDTLEQSYPLSPITKLMDKNYDPGRFRCYSFLNEVYGSSKNKVQSNLVNTNLAYSYSQFNGNNNAAKSLELTMKELIPLIKSNSNISRYVFPTSGTFNYRIISGTGQLSPHAFGIAIDLARDNRDYWQWTSPEEGQKRLSSYPKELVELFEKNGFIWGGKWNHFDILHYEYRPEITLKARYFSNNVQNKNCWYETVPHEEPHIKAYIEEIDKVLK